jgi:hypothetical protein
VTAIGSVPSFTRMKRRPLSEKHLPLNRVDWHKRDRKKGGETN